MRIDPQRIGNNVQESINLLAKLGEEVDEIAAVVAAGTGQAVYATMAAMRAGGAPATQLHLQGYYAPGDGGAGVFDYDPSDSTSVDNGGTVVVIEGKRFKRANTVVADATHFGVVASKSNAPVDVTAAMQAAIEATPRGGALFVRGCDSRAGYEYRLKSTSVTCSQGNYALHVKRQIHIYGTCADYNNASSGAVFRCDAGVGGIFVEGSDAQGGNVDGRFSVLEDFSLLSVQAGAVVHGIYAEGAFHFARIAAIGFAGCGFFGNGSGGGRNMNSWTAIDCTFNSNLQHGWFITGNDSNAGRAVGLNCNSNGGVGIWDSSFLGNTYLGCQSAINGGLPIGQDAFGRHLSYKTDGGSNSTAFVGCYSEDDEWLLLQGPAAWYGNRYWGSGPTPESGGHAIHPDSSYGLRFQTRGSLGPALMNTTIAPNDGTRSVLSFGLPGSGTYRLGMLASHLGNPQLEQYSFVWENSGNYSPCGFTADGFYRGAGRLLVTSGYMSRSLTATGSGGSKWYGVSGVIPFSAPGSGLIPHERGDRLDYDAPSPGGFTGRVCTRGGFYAAAVARGAAVTLGQKVRPAVDNGHVYNCTTAGTTHASVEPTYGVGTGSTTTDGTVVFTEFGASSLWSEYGQIANTNI